MSVININIDVDKVEFDIYEVRNKLRVDVIKDTILLPKSFNIGEKLRYVRKIIMTIVSIYKVKKAYINVEDGIGMDIIVTVKIEGTIEELFSDCGVMICK